jgi:hypothetical protein
MDVDIKEVKNPYSNSPKIFFKGTAEIAYFCRRILQNKPEELANEYPELLNRPIYEQHVEFAENFVKALKEISKENPTVRCLNPEAQK